jgi:hypothetical protein
VRDDDAGHLKLLLQLLDHLADALDVRGVEAGGRLVVQDNLGLDGDRARERGPLAHAAADRLAGMRYMMSGS